MNSLRKGRDVNARCTWCGTMHVRLTSDHVFPRAIGGTRELSVPACEMCQSTLSKAEGHFARNTLYALYTADAGPRGRDKRKPQSGIIKPKYILVPHPLGGYGEAGLRAGSGTLEALTHIEIDTHSQTAARVRGIERSDVDRLLDTFRAILHRSPDKAGFIGEIPVRTDPLGTIADDPDFWPRIVLDLAGDLFIRARDAAEAQSFLSVFVSALEAGLLANSGRWTRSEIIGGTPHTVSLRYSVKAVHTVICKIACGLAYLQCNGTPVWSEVLREGRGAVVSDGDVSKIIVIREVCQPGAISQWPGRHVAMVQRRDGRLRGIVSLYGDCHVVDLGAFSGAFEPVAAYSQMDGTRTRLVSREECSEIAEILDGYALSLARSAQS